MSFRDKDMKVIVEEYIKVSSFEDLTNSGNQYIFIGNEKYDIKYLVAAAAAIIEENIQIDLNNQTLNIWILDKCIKLKDINCSYVFLDIYEIIESNNNFYEYIKNYFNLWHESIENDFIYDMFHKENLANNFVLLNKIINKDIKLACSKNDYIILNIYKGLYNFIINFLIYSKI